MLDSVLKRLAGGCFVCPVSYAQEFAALQEPENFRRTEEWLSAAGYRLARLGTEGAYFMAHDKITPEMRARFRAEMRNIRGVLEPVVGFMETLRQAQGQNPQIQAGDMIWESQISEAVRGSAMLERRLQEMRDITGSRITDSSIDRVRRMLTQLVSDGYLVETNVTSKGYQVTGKIDYLYQLIGFIATNSNYLSDEGVVDQIDDQPRLDGLDTVPVEPKDPPKDTPKDAEE